MPEAVIVAAARSPIGRAFKGSLRPSGPTTSPQMVRAALDQVPALDPHQIDDLMLGLRPARRRAGLQHGPRRRRAARLRPLPGTTVTRYCSSSLQTTRMAMHAIRAGEGDVFISAGVETVSRFAKGSSDTLAGHAQPDIRRGRGAHREAAERGATTGTIRGRTACCPTSTWRWARPPRTWRSSRASPARTWTTSACARRTWPSRRSRTASGRGRSRR